MTRRTLIINGALLVAIIVIGVVAYSWLHTSPKATAARQTTTVTQGDITSTVSASGNVASAVNLGVSFSGCSGVLTSVSVKPGDTTTAGQTLATVDNTAAAAAVTTAQNSLAQAQATLSNSISSANTSLKNANTTASLDADQAYAAMLNDYPAFGSTSIAQTYYNSWVANGSGAVTPAGASPALLKDYQSFEQTQAKDNQQVTSAQTALTQAQASTSQQAAAVTTAQTAVTTAQANLTNCTLISPTAATVITVNGTVGATPGSGSVASGGSSSSSSSTGTGSSSTGTGASSTSSSSTSASSSGSGSSGSTSSTAGVSTSSGFITLADMTKLIVPGSVTESDIANVKVGDAVAIVFAALTDANDPNGTTVPGTISEVDLTSTVSSSVVSYGVTISLTSPPANLRLGQSGSATITTSSKQNVLRVASNAITTTGRLKTATVVNGNTTHIVTVTTGVTGNGETEVETGLQAGDVVQLPTTTGTTNTFNLLGGGGSLLGGGR
jgi:multidrug efflux pump subunit AcrA (membrane-fusion protein)